MKFFKKSHAEEVPETEVTAEAAEAAAEPVKKTRVKAGILANDFMKWSAC